MREIRYLDIVFARHGPRITSRVSTPDYNNLIVAADGGFYVGSAVVDPGSFKLGKVR
jgi:hypothetical protein